MLNLSEASKYQVRNVSQPQTSAWRVYSRLLAYAWRFRVRLVLSLLFSLLIAASFVSIVVSVGAFVNIIFYTPQPVAESGELPPDPADQIADKALEKGDWLVRALGYDTQALKARFQDYVATVRATGASKMHALKVLAAVLVGLALVAGLARFLQEYYAGSIGANISVTLGREMYENVVRQPLGFFETHPSGEILARFTNDILMVNRGLAAVLVKLLREPIKIVFFLIMALRVDVGLTLIGLCALPPIGFVIVRIGKKVKKSVRRSLQKIASMATVVSDTFRGIAVIKGFCMESHEVQRMRTELHNLRRYLLQMVKANALVGPLTELILVLAIVAFVLFSGYKVTQTGFPPGDLIALYGYLALMLDPVRKLSSVNNMIQTSVASAERVFEFMDVRSDVVEAPDAVAIAPLSEALRFEDVRFSYDGQTDVLNGVTVEVRKGEMVALVGFSGAGKTTLVKLIPRFYDVTGGAVTIDGTDIRRATFESLRKQVGMVPQDTYLFHLTVRENLAFGQDTFSDERIRDAARAARAHEFIEKLPQGYDTRLGEGATTLSGGQRQRLAIARALVKDPAILILDEATSNLDSESEQAIQRAIEEMVVGRTTIVIAHRLSTIQRADRILVLDEGRIAEEGTHAQLLARDGLYTRLYETQFGNMERAPRA